MRGARRLQRAAQRVETREAQKTGVSPTSRALAALTGSALALPGLAGSASAEGGAVDTLTLTYQGSRYVEDKVKPKGDVTVVGDDDRYEIDSHQFQIKTPFTRRTDLTFDVLYEEMSGSSPWNVNRDLVSGNYELVMSGATIQDERLDITSAYNYHLNNGGFGFSGGISTERDYFSGNGGFNASFDFNEKNTVITTALGVSFDTIKPTEDVALDAGRPEKERKQGYTFHLGGSQVLSRHSIFQTGLTFKHSRGYLSDPYKLVSANNVSMRDSRPDSRNQVAIMARYRHHVEMLNASLHADYNFFTDDWGIFAHTLELGWHQTLFDYIRLIPSARYYTQTQADFYDLVFAAVPDDGHMSNDYRLSPYGAISWRVKAEVDVPHFVPPHWTFLPQDYMVSIAWERYLSDGDFSLKKVGLAHPGLVDFNIFSFQLKAKF